MQKSIDSPEKKSSAPRDWTQGSITQNILLLSWPMIILGALYTANLILELIWVGKLGSAAIAGVGVAGIVVLLVSTIKSGLGAGERAMVARLVGAGDITEANHVSGQAFIISAVYGALITLVGIFLSEPIFGLFGLAPDVAAEGVIYLRIVLIGWFTEAFWITSLYVIQSSGDVMIPMKIAVIIRIVNVVICPFLVLGWWIFPRLGVAGAAYAYIITTALGMALCFWVLFNKKTRIQLTWKDFSPDGTTIRRILKIGLPSSVMGLGKTFGDLVFAWLMIPFGTLPLAAHNLLSRIESFINSPSMSVGMSSGVMVGQNLGAKQPQKASRSGWIATGLIVGYMFVCIIVLLIWSENIIGLFNVESDLVQVGSVFLRIAVAGYLGMSVVYVLQSSITGSGDTTPPMIITLVMLWVVQLPLAYLLSHYTGLGVYGVRWAIVIGYIMGALAYIIYFWSSRWKRKKI
jgi:putative MATE family efflux protein